MSGLSDLGAGASPYPGLRPFRSDEADIFFGREEYIDHLLEKLGQNRFLAVMGPSGCGKSSLMQAGVIPALQTGFLADAGAEWRIATMRPGNHPMERLAESLLGEVALGPERADTTAASAILQATLLRGPLGLVEVLRETPLPEAASLLLLVDQFEEIFRFRQQGYSSEAEADAFVELLLATVAQREVPIYVVLTMRSDFFGDCALFHDLPEAINNSQFLTPRLTRTQQQVAIEGPASVFGGTIEAALANRLLNDMGPDPDQLPLMQHVLMRMWTQKVAGAAEKDVQGAGITLTLTDYMAIGGLSEALSRHADEALAELDERHRRVAEVLFRCLSERSLEHRDTRRPVAVSTVAAVAGVSWQQVAEVVEVFRRPDRSFLTPPVGMVLQPETILDISHESLIRQWRRMTEWVEKEAISADAYRRLEQTARLWHAESDEHRRKDYFWHGHELGLALEWRTQESPTSLWAERYGTAFDLAMAFLDASAQDEEARRQQQEAAQKRELQRTRQRLCGALIGLAIALGIALYAWYLQSVAAEAEQGSERARLKAVQAEQDSERARLEAVQAKNDAHVRQLVTEARRRPDELGVLLALQALKMHQGEETVEPERQIDEALWEILGAPHFNHILAAPSMGRVRVVAFSADSRWLAVAVRSTRLREGTDTVRSREEETDTVWVWDLHQPERPPQALPHKGRIRALVFSPQGHLLASSGQERRDGPKIRLWDLDMVMQSQAAESLYEPKSLPIADKYGAVQSLAFGPGGDRLVAGTNRGIVLVWDVQDGTMPLLLTEPDDSPDSDSQNINSVAFSPDGCWVAAGGRDKRVRLWEVVNAQQGTNNEPLTLIQHEDAVTSVAFSPGFDMVPNTNSGVGCQQRYILASGSFDTTVLFWEIVPSPTASGASDAMKPFKELQIEEGGVWALAFSRDGKLLASVGDDGAVRLWDWQQLTPFPIVLHGHDGSVSTVAFSSDGRWIASGGFDRTVRLWEMHSPYILRGHENGIPAVAFSPDGQRIVSGGMDNTVRLWQASTLWRTNASSTSACPLCPFQGMNSQEAANLAQETKSFHQELETRHTKWVWAVAFSPDGHTFASGGFDKTVYLWDTLTQTSLPQSLDHESRVTAVQFLPQETALLMTFERGERGERGERQGTGKVHLWDVESLKRLPGDESGTPPSHSAAHRGFSTQQRIWSAAFSRDGHRLITGGSDGAVYLWDMQEVLASKDGSPIEPRKKFRHHRDGFAWTVAFSPDNRTIASGSVDTTIYLRDVDSGACTVLGGSQGHKGWVMNVAFSPDGQLLASGGNDGTVRLWNVIAAMQQARPGDPCEASDLEPEAVMRGHAGMVRSLAFSLPDGKWLISGGGDKTLRLWPMQKNIQTEILQQEACQRVWRNLSLDEWENIVRGKAKDYEPTCPHLPPHPSIQTAK